MKKLLFIPIMLFYSISYSQSKTQFELSKDGLTDYIVTDVEGKTKEEIYKRTLEWINRSFKNPREVLKGEVVNEYVRFEGLQTGMDCYKVLGVTACRDIKYHVEVSMKDNKYKFDILDVQRYITPGRYSRGGWEDLYSNENLKRMYRKDGTLKDENHLTVPNSFNKLNTDLKNYIEKGALSEPKSDW